MLFTFSSPFWTTNVPLQSQSHTRWTLFRIFSIEIQLQARIPSISRDPCFCFFLATQCRPWLYHDQNAAHCWLQLYCIDNLASWMLNTSMHWVKMLCFDSWNAFWMAVSVQSLETHLGYPTLDAIFNIYTFWWIVKTGKRIKYDDEFCVEHQHRGRGNFGSPGRWELCFSFIVDHKPYSK